MMSVIDKTNIMMKVIWTLAMDNIMHNTQFPNSINYVTIILRPFQLELKLQTDCGNKHNKTTHVKTFIDELNVSYAPTYIFRSSVYQNYS